jgi:hypothetical protein
MHMRRTLLTIVVLTLASACGTSSEEKKSDEGAGQSATGVSSPDAPDLGEPDDEGILMDSKKAAAEQLDCPLEQVRIMCKTRDADGMCSAVRAYGCDKELEYSFGGE